MSSRNSRPAESVRQPGGPLKKLWVVSEHYYPDESATGYLLTRIAEGLAEHYSVNALCSYPSRLRGEVRPPMQERRNRVQIRRCAATTLDKDVLVFRLINLVTISVSIFWNCLWSFRRNDTVLVVTNPPSLPFFVAASSWLRNAKCILIVHDVYPEALIAAGILKPQSSVTELLNWLHKRLYRHVEEIVPIGRDMRALLMRKNPSPRITVAFIPNWADTEIVEPGKREENRMLRELNLTNKFVVQYSGNIGRTHGVEVIIEAARRLSREDSVHFLVLGSGAKKKWMEATVEESHLSSFTILPRHPRSDLDAALNACDVAIVSFVPGMTGVSVPSRMYNFMAAGKPIIAIADPDSELAMVVDENEIGWVVSPGQPDAVVAAILEARNGPERLAGMGQRARLAAAEKYTYEKTIGAYRELIEGINGFADRSHR